MRRWAVRWEFWFWSEFPVIWTFKSKKPAVLAKAEQQLHEMIRRDRNKASVGLWSVANETPITPARVQFLKTLAAKAREQDPTSLLAAALLERTSSMTKIIDVPQAEALEVIGYN